jgi:hypothetical protein
MKQLPWILLVLALGLAAWLALALVGAENMRHALIGKACPLIHGQVDRACLAGVSSRDHWWQHLGYAMTHLGS